MVYYVLLIALILILRNNLSKFTEGIERDKKEDKYAIWVWTIIVVMAALRGLKVGTDTLGYFSDYYEMPYYDTFSSLNERYEGYLGYYYTSKVFSLIGLPVQVWFGFVEAVYAYSLYLLTKRFSKDKLFSILVFVTIGLFSFSMAGLKQVMSMSFMIFAFISFLDKKYWITAICILVSYSCHPAGLVFFAAFPLYIIRERKMYISFLVVTALMVYAYGEVFLAGMVEQLGNDHFEGYLVKDTSYTAVTLVYYVAILAMGYMGYKSYYQEDANTAKFMFGTSIIMCALQALASISPNMFRLALCYAPFMMVLLPNSCYYSKNKTMSWMIIGSIVFYFLYTSRNTPYSFFWQIS